VQIYYSTPKSQLGWLNLPRSPKLYYRQWLPDTVWSNFRRWVWKGNR